MDRCPNGMHTKMATALQRNLSRTEKHRASDPMQLYFTSGTTSKPKLVMHTHVTLSGRASLDHVLDRAAARRHTLQHFVSRLGETCLELLFRALERRGDGFRPKSVTLQREGAARGNYAARSLPFVLPPTVWRMLVTHQLADYKTKLRELVSAGEPLNPEIIDHVQSAWGLRSATDMAKPKPPRWLATSPANSSSRHRWADRCLVLARAAGRKCRVVNRHRRRTLHRRSIPGL